MSIVQSSFEILKLCYRKGVFMCRTNLKEARKGKNMTQQAMADYLNIGLRHYQQLEYCESYGSFEIWDALEDFLGIHQRKLREISSNRPAQARSP